jgi:hypothetical protein
MRLRASEFASSRVPWKLMTDTVVIAAKVWRTFQEKVDARRVFATKTLPGARSPACNGVARCHAVSILPRSRNFPQRP